MSERYGGGYGGFDASGGRGTSWVSVLIGWLTALGASLILSGIFGGIVGIFAAGATAQGSGSAGLVGLLVTLFVAFFTGGYAAGRMASRDGAKHGLLVALVALAVTLVLAIVGGAIGASFLDSLRGVTLPGVPADIAQQGLNTVLTLSGVLALLLPFVAGALGGSRGASVGARRP